MFRVACFKFRVSGFGFQDSCFEFRVSCFRFRVPCFVFRGQGEGGRAAHPSGLVQREFEALVYLALSTVLCLFTSSADLKQHIKKINYHILLAPRGCQYEARRDYPYTPLSTLQGVRTRVVMCSQDEIDRTPAHFSLASRGRALSTWRQAPCSASSRRRPTWWGVLSDTMNLFLRFRNSTSRQNCQLNIPISQSK